MNDKYTDSDIRVDNAFLKKLDHFWFYYKWHTFIALFVVFVLAICIVQSCTKTDYDVNVLYAGPYDFVGEEAITPVSDVLNATLPRDFNKDGEKQVGLIAYQVMTKEQIEQKQEELKQMREEGKPVGSLDTSYFSTQSSLFHSALQSGEYAVLLVDESVYQSLMSIDGRLRKLSEVLVTVPSGAFSEYGIRLGETDLYKNNPSIGVLSEDTVLCLASPLVFGKTSKSTEYAKMVEMFVTMAEG